MKTNLKTKDVEAAAFVTMSGGDIADVIVEKGTATYIFNRSVDNLNLYRHYCLEINKEIDGELNVNYVEFKSWINYYLKLRHELKKGTK